MTKKTIKITWYWKELKQSLYTVEELIRYLNKYSLLNIKAIEGSWIIGISDRLASTIEFELKNKFNLNTLKVREASDQLKPSLNFTNYFCKVNIEKTQKRRHYQNNIKIRKQERELQLWKQKVKESIIIAHSDPTINLISETISKYKN